GASDSVSSSELFCVTALAFRTGPLTPLGRTISESTTSCARALSPENRISAQRNQIRLRQIMDAKLWTKRSPTQVGAAAAALQPRRPAEEVRAGLPSEYYFLARSISSTS